jgi:hypothetical protein
MKKRISKFLALFGTLKFHMIIFLLYKVLWRVDDLILHQPRSSSHGQRKKHQAREQKGSGINQEGKEGRQGRQKIKMSFRKKTS